MRHHKSLTNSERLKCCSVYALLLSLDGQGCNFSSAAAARALYFQPESGDWT
jgi:hypothetical protein